MIVKVIAKRQVTFPARVLEVLGVKSGDRLELEVGPEGFTLRPRRLNPARLAPLRGKIRKDKDAFDLEVFSDQPHDPALRD